MGVNALLVNIGLLFASVVIDVRGFRRLPRADKAIQDKVWPMDGKSDHPRAVDVLPQMAGPDSFVQPGRQLFTLVQTDTGFLLVQGEGIPKNAAANWDDMAKEAADMAAQGALPGFDGSTMEVKPMKVPSAWGVNAGPHYSVVLHSGGRPTQDALGKVDIMTQDVQAKFNDMEKEYYLSTDNMHIKYLLGSAGNDEATNGPIMIVRSNDDAGATLTKIRADLGFGPFPPTHSIHTTLAKIDGPKLRERADKAVEAGDWPKAPNSPYPMAMEELPPMRETRQVSELAVPGPVQIDAAL